MHHLERIVRELAAADTPNIDSAGAVAEFQFAGPVRLKRVGLIVTTEVNPDNSVALTLAMSRRVTLGSASGAVSLGVFTVMAANAANLAVGKYVYKDLHIDDADGETAEDGTTRYEAPNSNLTSAFTRGNPFDIPAGQSFALTLESNAEADSGAVRAFVEYEHLPLSGPYRYELTNINEDTSNKA